MGNDIFVSEKFTINQEKGEIYVGNCGITTPLFIKDRAIQVNHTIHIKKITIISLHTTLSVIIHFFSAIFSDRDFIFQPLEMNFSSCAHTLNAGTKTILVWNDEKLFLCILRNFPLKHLTEMDCLDVFQAKDAFFINNANFINVQSENKKTFPNDLSNLAHWCLKSEH